MKSLYTLKKNALKIGLILAIATVSTVTSFAQNTIDIEPFWGGSSDQILNKHGRLVISSPILALDPTPTGALLKLFVNSSAVNPRHSAFSDVTSKGKVHVIGCEVAGENERENPIIDGRVGFGPNSFLSPNSDSDTCVTVHGEALATNFLPQAGDTTPNRHLCADINGVMSPCAIPPAGTGFSCTGSVPANSELCFQDNMNLTADTPRSLTFLCSNTQKCEHKCRQGHYFDLTSLSCIPHPPQTQGAVACTTSLLGPLLGGTACISGSLVPGSNSVTWEGNNITSIWQCSGLNTSGDPTVVNCSEGGTFNFNSDYQVNWMHG